MKLFSFLTILVLIFVACGKDSPDPDPPPVVPPVTPPVIKDTLATGWTIDTSITTTNNDIFFVNNVGYLVAENIYKSIDGGLSWIKVHSGELITENIAMHGEFDAVFSSVNGGKLFVTHDGGNKMDSLVLDDSDISDVFFLDAKTVGAIGKYFWISIDAGDSWTKLSDNNSAGFGGNYKSLFFLNAQTGWISGRAGIFKTIDGGKNWEKQSTPDFYLETGVGGGNIYFLDSLHGSLTDNNGFGNTDNSGIAWTRRFTMQTFYHDIHFVDANTGYLTDKQYIWKTIDGGLTWKKEVVLKNRTVIELHFTDANHGWACGTGFVLRYSK